MYNRYLPFYWWSATKENVLQKSIEFNQMKKKTIAQTLVIQTIVRYNHNRLREKNIKTLS